MDWCLYTFKVMLDTAAEDTKLGEVAKITDREIQKLSWALESL
jgi:hypothetical protein